jgi:hypothetical protein
MGHYISGFIADKDKLKEAVEEVNLSGCRVAIVIKLNSNNLGFLPYTDELYEQMKKSYFHNFDFPVAFISTDYWGGFGTQKAKVKKGKEILLAKGKINDALKILGVQRTERHDEFDVVGLGMYRLNETWVQRGERV